MQYTLLITARHTKARHAHTALRFIEAAMKKHPDSIKGVFFYEDAVLIAIKSHSL